MSASITQLNAHLSFDGQCEAAFRFYEQCLGGAMECLVRYEDRHSDSGAPPDWREKVMHATLRIGAQVLMGADIPPGQYLAPQGFSITLGLADAAEAERIFSALAENGKTIMPMGETFWAARFGAVIDRFGIPWTINCGRPECSGS